MNTRLQLADVLLSEGHLVPIDLAVSLMADGMDMQTIEDRIDGYSIIDFEEVDYSDYE
jgi:hypothetical protein